VNLPETHWRVYAGVSTEWVYAPVREAATRIGILALIALALVVTVTVSVYRRIDRSLLALVGGTRAAALGSDALISLEGPREVVQVANQFNLMLAARAEAESEVRRAEARYRSILQNAAFGIYLTDTDGRFLVVNPALAEMLGYADVEELLERRVQEVYEDPRTYLSILRSCENDGGAERWEVGWRRRDGSRISVRVTGSTFLSADGVRSYEVIAEDVTQHRALEAQFRQAQKMQAIGRLAGGVAHDFNNLLTVINGEARFLLEDLPEGHRTRGSAEEILASGERAAALTRQLLAFSRKEVGRPVPTDLNELIEHLDKMLRRLIGERIRFELDLSAAPGPVLADPTRLEQVVMNLVLNARDAMPAGGTLTIETRFEALGERQVVEEYPGLPAGAYALLRVTDTGVGMEEAVLQRVFEPFFTTKPEGEGTGLGLSTVYGIVTQSGGHISVNSEPGEGTVFTVAVPMADEVRSAPAAARPDPVGEPGRRTILVVEDERSVRDMVCRVLDRGGYAVLSAANGKEALEQAASYPDEINLVLTDVRMPVMNGREMAERMASVRPAARILSCPAM